MASYYYNVKKNQAKKLVDSGDNDVKVFLNFNEKVSVTIVFVKHSNINDYLHCRLKDIYSKQLKPKEKRQSG